MTQYCNINSEMESGDHGLMNVAEIKNGADSKYFDFSNHKSQTSRRNFFLMQNREKGG